MPRIRISRELLQAIEARTRASKVEAGGLLLGRVSRETGTVSISGEVPLPETRARHEVAPEGHLNIRVGSGGHCLRLGRQDFPDSRGLGGKRVLGWWHSHPLAGWGPTEKDGEAHRAHFRHPDQVLIITRPPGPLSDGGYAVTAGKGVGCLESGVFGSRNVEPNLEKGSRCSLVPTPEARGDSQDVWGVALRKG